VEQMTGLFLSKVVLMEFKEGYITTLLQETHLDQANMTSYPPILSKLLCLTASLEYLTVKQSSFLSQFHHFKRGETAS
jgi:hypothetical protein